MGANRDLALDECQPEMELPFSVEEFQQRLQRIRTRMENGGIDVLWLMAPESLFYVSGYTCEWYQAQSPKSWPATSGIAIHRDRDDFILFDTPSEQIMVRFATIAEDIRIFPIDDRRDGIAFIIDELRASGLLGGTVGLEFYSYRPNPAISQRFRSAFEAADCAVTDGSDVLRDVRWVKSPQEMDYIERAANITDIGLAAAAGTIRPGVTELEVWGEIIAAMTRAGGENPGLQLPVTSGLKANTGHSLPSRKKILAGEQVNVDVSGVFNRYHCNAARSFFVGAPPEDVAAYYAKSVGVFDVMAGLLRPNLPVVELVDECRRYYQEAGIWSDAGWVGGYELGIGFPPDWVGNFVYEVTGDDSGRVFEPGTVVNYETQFFGPRLTGITYTICTLMFREESAGFPVQTPRELTVLEA